MAAGRAAVLLLASCVWPAVPGRVAEPPVRSSPHLRERLDRLERSVGRFSSARRAQLESSLERILRRSGGVGEGGEQTDQPEFAGAWRTVRYENIDDFLDRSMGVSYIKRRIAAKASQTQRLHQEGSGARAVIHLELSDKRGTAKYTIRPDGREHSGRGFSKLPISQRARMKNGALLVEERYFQRVRAPSAPLPAAAPAAAPSPRPSPPRRLSSSPRRPPLAARRRSPRRAVLRRRVPGGVLAPLGHQGADGGRD